MENFDFFAIQSTTDASEGDWSIETVASNLNDLAYTYRLLRLTNPNLYYRVVHISLKTEVVVSHESQIIGDKA